ncbi:unnamed protein product [Rotaria sp. Silwood2]|nr:unnamed protein product [Rotaria sp. Silwood2]CAF2549662.1 unnamed protein product [Rotaria sp. Silwood2]CAF2800193.1 unnamed protein product [Rotaria sp. Silwood2]CAF2958004.1 unnamed protein product [Rotaria sp. Silwood2]CAF3992968.1 unnamed protein product [Rotaria sp. Silwood2]
MASSFDYDSYIKRCVFAWVSVGLIWKNITFFLILVMFRLQDKQTIRVADEQIIQRQTGAVNQTIPSKTQQLNHVIKHKHSAIKKRITKLLEYETHYMAYFFILFYVFTESLQGTTTRQIVYGCVFVIARCVHNGGLLLRYRYARIIGILFSILVIAAITLDLAIILTNDVLQKPQ